MRRSQCTCEPSPGGMPKPSTSTTPPSESPAFAASLISRIISASASGSTAANLGRVDRVEVVGPGPAVGRRGRRAELHDVAEHRDAERAASSALASAPAATRAAVSRALARSSTSRASVKPYFCMPARSA